MRSEGAPLGDPADRVLVTRRPPGDVVDRLRSTVGAVTVWEQDGVIPREMLLDMVTDATGLYCMLTESIDRELLDAAPDLRVVSSMSVGVDHIDVTACTRRGIPVGHTPGVLAGTVADTAIALLLAVSRRIVEGADHVREGRWGEWDPELLLGGDLHGSTVGIVGLGAVGREVAKRLSGFGCTVLAFNRTRRPQVAAELGVEWRSLETLLAESDHVVISIALTDETRRLIDGAALARMKPKATLVNVARGPIVDQAALAEALGNGTIGAAGLDVTDPEPIDPADPLLSLPNCVVIPHLGSASHRTRMAMADLAADNLIAGLAGEPMPASANTVLLSFGEPG